MLGFFAIIVPLAVAVAVAAYILFPWIVRNRLRRLFVREARRSPCVCLTFDDGPDPQVTPQVLDVLASANVRATFFLVARKAVQHPEIVAGIRQAGHEIGEHGFRHAHPWRTWSPAAWSEHVRARNALRAMVGEQQELAFRPPFGKLNLLTWLYTRRFQKRVVFWTLDPRDYEQTDPERLADDLLERMRPGAVVLLHDGNAKTLHETPVLVGALQRLVRSPKAREFEFATVSEALSMPALRPPRQQPDCR
ncbi:MAG: polysaccharide deacetylase family protein [Candidatus Sumerlaeota bacterium]|nr:polysaccharide deacetylase family protein [Candidatus Sumerlaeota bacterium]